MSRDQRELAAALRRFILAGLQLEQHRDQAPATAAAVRNAIVMAEIGLAQLHVGDDRIAGMDDLKNKRETVKPVKQEPLDKGDVPEPPHTTADQLPVISPSDAS